MSPSLSFLLLLSLLAIASSASHHPSPVPVPVPAPAVDCSSLVLQLADCLTYVSNGSNTTKPEGSCCSGLKTVLKTDAECLCQAFKSSADFGVVLNVTKALALPDACKLHAPPASNCGLSLSKGAAPALSPSSVAGAPTVTVGSNAEAPAPSPGVSGSNGLCVSFVALLVGIVFASLPSF